ncbi:hypothetical protein TEA_005260 [Camellia sinensis var. sinensis]|uniref:Uncharacterized protein n=1 Tax=Camellia sinensis var. sinensis TaxID=542762 RepID=A0A4V3WM00_CAMSN|nr:hypothetical protein TEA_005260 [Camellia sinensis var. sinensis]
MENFIDERVVPPPWVADPSDPLIQAPETSRKRRRPAGADDNDRPTKRRKIDRDNGNVDSEPEGSGSFTEEAYNPCGYIVSTDQAKPRVELSTRTEIDVVREDGPSQGLDNLAKLEEDISNLQFFDEQDLGNVQLGWYDANGAIDATRWLNDEPNVVEVPQSEQGQSETGTSAVAGMAENHEESPESTGAKNFARDLGSLCTAGTEQENTLRCFEQERIEDEDRGRKAKAPAETECAVSTRTATTEPDSYLIVNVQLGETSRLAWLGVGVDPLAQSDAILKAYNRPSEPASQLTSNWFISKNAIVSGFSESNKGKATLLLMKGRHHLPRLGEKELSGEN